MNVERDFILKEAEHIGKTLDLIDPLLAKSTLNQYESIALGTLLQNVYMGIESVLRCQLQEQGRTLSKAENWHKELLQAAFEYALVESSEYPVFRALLLYRHRHIHGYGHMLDEARLRDLAAPVPLACRSYLQRLTALYS